MTVDLVGSGSHEQNVMQDPSEDLLDEGEREGGGPDNGCCGGGRGGRNYVVSNRQLPSEFKACFSKTREMRWGLWCPHDRDWMQLVKDNYEKHHRRRRQRQGVLPRQTQEGCRSLRDDCILIPRTIHHIWLGSPLPEAFARLRESWGAKHEDNWELKLWTEADVEAFGLENREAYVGAGNFGEKSDILRYEILFRYGGLYVDVDFLCLGAFDDLHRSYDFYTGVSNTGTFELNNGLVGCRPGHPIMRNIINRIRGSSAPSLPPQLSTDHGATGCTAGTFAALSNPVTVSPHGPSLPRSTMEGTVGVASPTEWIDEGGSGGGAMVGNPLAGLMGSLGGMGAAAGGGGGGGGLLAELLGSEDKARLIQAVEVEPGSATATIARTGPGVFTTAVMEWMASPAYLGGRAPCATENVDNANSDAGSHREETDRTTETVMVLPPSFFYPVPNDAKGCLIGDGGEAEIRAGGAGRFLSEESLAVHLWGKSWQKTTSV